MTTYTIDKMQHEIARDACRYMHDCGLRAPGGIGVLVDHVAGDVYRLTLLAHGDGHFRSSEVMSGIRDTSLLLAAFMGARGLCPDTSLEAERARHVARKANDVVEVYTFAMGA